MPQITRVMFVNLKDNWAGQESLSQFVVKIVRDHLVLFEMAQWTTSLVKVLKEVKAAAIENKR